jgi:predicted alpha/beta hydrolase family esterase
VKQAILFLQGGGKGAHAADGKLVASLRGALGASYEIVFPKVPDEQDPDYEKWKPVIAKELARLKAGSILTGHSLGGSFLLKYLVEEPPRREIAGIFLIATPYWGGDGWRYEGYERVALPEGFAARLPRGASVFMYHSRNDEVVPYAHLALYADKLPQAKIRSLERGHQLNDDLSEVAGDIESLR